MWSWSLEARENGLRREDRDLARYARWEYGGSDGLWLVAQARRQARKGGKRGLRRWFNSLFRTRTPSEAVMSAEPPSDSGLGTANDGGVLLTEEVPVEEVPVEECTHDSLESLGGGGNAAYYRCQACGDVLIAQGGTWWVLRRSA